MLFVVLKLPLRFESIVNGTAAALPTHFQLRNEEPPRPCFLAFMSDSKRQQFHGVANLAFWNYFYVYFSVLIILNPTLI